jgi:hypothetical protein
LSEEANGEAKEDEEAVVKNCVSVYKYIREKLYKKALHSMYGM